MRGFLRLTWWTVLVSCSGSTEPTPFEEREICDDEVDNNGNGLVDCDDTEFCGGVRCVTTTGDDDDDTTELPLVEIDYPGADIFFDWTTGTCPVLVKSMIIVNRSTEEEGEVDASCDLLNGSTAALRFQIDGGEVKTFLVDEDLAISGQMQLDMFFNCDADEQFTTRCRVKGTVEGVVDEIEFDVTGTPL